jgi:glyoxylase-like metal-dependent hydrolase (beta-lactamase superfamily II)
MVRGLQPPEAEKPVDEPTPLHVGVPRALSPLVRRILAPNPGIMTGPGTNTYLVGIDEIAVIDPGPDDADHLDAVAGCGGGRIRWILCTHTHPDHAPGAKGLAERTGAEVLGFGSVGDDGFQPDRTLADDDRLDGSEWRLTAVHTPGHASNHLCFLLQEEHLLFTGDHLMQGSTVVIKPPDGDMAVYLESLAKVRALRLKAIAPGHGHVVDEPKDLIDSYVQHRIEREQQVLAALADAGTATVEQLVEVVYTDVDEERHPVAAHTVLAHLRKAQDEGKASTDGDRDSIESTWSPV